MAKPNTNRTQASHTRGGKAFEVLIFEIFKTFNRLNTAGDDLSKEFGLSSARWRVLGSACKEAKTASAIARERGLTRQSVQQVVDTLIEDGLVELKDNANHKSAKLVAPTALGRTMIRRVNEKATGWQNHIAEAASVSDLQITARTLASLCERLEDEYP